MKINLILKGVLSLTLVMLVQTVFAKALIFTSPPREKPEEGKKLYGPIAEHFSKLLGREVVYEHPKNWLNYQRDMRNDRYDIVFDGPHFISWRMEHLGHDVVAKLPGTLEFYLVTKKDQNYNDTNGLIAKKICGINPPNLSTLSILAAYPNPVRQPVIKGINGGMGAVHKTHLKGKDCTAAVLRDTFYSKKLSEQQRNELKIIYKSTPLPNQGFSVSKRVTQREKTLLVQSLAYGDGARASADLLKRFAGKAKSFKAAANSEYLGHNMLLEGVIFGW